MLTTVMSCHLNLFSNFRLLQRLKCIEQRALEQKMEINSELCSMKQLIAENMPDLPEKYKKYMADPVCDEDNVIKNTFINTLLHV